MVHSGLAASSSLLTPLTEARGYLVVACSTEQTLRSEQLAAQVLRQAAATNRTFLAPGVAGSYAVEPWTSRVAVCGTAAAGGARVSWNVLHLRDLALRLGSDVVALDALSGRMAELLGSGVPPPGFDRILDMLPCSADLGLCAQGGGQTALGDGSAGRYEQARAVRQTDRRIAGQTDRRIVRQTDGSRVTSRATYGQARGARLLSAHSRAYVLLIRGCPCICAPDAAAYATDAEADAEAESEFTGDRPREASQDATAPTPPQPSPPPPPRGARATAAFGGLAPAAVAGVAVPRLTALMPCREALAPTNPGAVFLRAAGFEVWLLPLRPSVFTRRPLILPLRLSVLLILTP